MAAYILPRKGTRQREDNALPLGMGPAVLPYIERLARETNRSEAEVIALAVGSGVRQLWRERVLGCYLRGEMSRDETVAEVGVDWVELAERQRNAALEDLEWALKE